MNSPAAARTTTESATCPTTSARRQRAGPPAAHGAPPLTSRSLGERSDPKSSSAGTRPKRRPESAEAANAKPSTRRSVLGGEGVGDAVEGKDADRRPEERFREHEPEGAAGEGEERALEEQVARQPAARSARAPS